MKIIFLLSRFPYPLEKGDKLRAFQQLVNLHASGHEVHVIAISDEHVIEKSIQKIKPFCKSISVLPLPWTTIFANLINSFLRHLPLQAGYFFSPKNKKKIDELIAAIQPEIIYCQLIRTALYVKNRSDVPLVLDYQDAFSKGTFQRKEAAPWWTRFLFSRELKLVKLLELQSYQWFNGHLIISKQDRNALAVNMEKPISIVPNGVDISFYFPLNAEKRWDVTFVGNMNYTPNVDGATFLVQNIMPLVWKKFPSARVQIAGANPNAKVNSLASDLVSVTGWVEDIRDCYSTSKVFVAPMRIGTGLQNKLLEAMAMGIPCVTTPLSFEPLGAKAGADILVGSDALQLSEHIVTLLENSELRKSTGINGLNFVIKNYSMEYSRTLLNKVLENAVSAFHQKKK